MSNSRIRLVIFDWAGTAVDYGCFAPVAAMIDSFAQYGVPINTDEARAPMGLHKRDHLEAIATQPDVTARWRDARGQDWTTADIDEMYESYFIPRQLEVAREHSQLIPGLLDTVAYLVRHEIKIGSTTGYFRGAAELVWQAAAEQGYRPDCNRCADDVPRGRPAPWMIFDIMRALNVYPPECVVKIGDTVPDIHEGRNAAAWSIGVSHSSGEVGLSLAEFRQADDDRRAGLVEAASAKLKNAGAHAVIPTIAELPELIESGFFNAQ